MPDMALGRCYDSDNPCTIRLVKIGENRAGFPFPKLELWIIGLDSSELVLFLLSRNSTLLEEADQEITRMHEVR